MSITLPPSYQMTATYATPRFALELRETGMTHAQISYELDITMRQCRRWIEKARKETKVSKKKVPAKPKKKR